MTLPGGPVEKDHSVLLLDFKICMSRSSNSWDVNFVLQDGFRDIWNLITLLKLHMILSAAYERERRRRCDEEAFLSCIIFLCCCVACAQKNTNRSQNALSPEQVEQRIGNRKKIVSKETGASLPQLLKQNAQSQIKEYSGDDEDCLNLTLNSVTKRRTTFDDYYFRLMYSAIHEYAWILSNCENVSSLILPDSGTDLCVHEESSALKREPRLASTAPGLTEVLECAGENCQVHLTGLLASCQSIFSQGYAAVNRILISCLMTRNKVAMSQDWRSQMVRMVSSQNILKIEVRTPRSKLKPALSQQELQNKKSAFLNQRRLDFGHWKTVIRKRHPRNPPTRPSNRINASVCDMKIASVHERKLAAKIEPNPRERQPQSGSRRDEATDTNDFELSDFLVNPYDQESSTELGKLWEKKAAESLHDLDSMYEFSELLWGSQKQLPEPIDDDKHLWNKHLKCFVPFSEPNEDKEAMTSSLQNYLNNVFEKPGRPEAPEPVNNHNRFHETAISKRQSLMRHRMPSGSFSLKPQCSKRLRTVQKTTTDIPKSHSKITTVWDILKPEEKSKIFNHSPSESCLPHLRLFRPFPVAQIVAYPFTSLRPYFQQFQDGSAPLEERMRFEGNRLQTFNQFPLSFPVSAIRLARAGFYATGRGNETACFCCGMTYTGWSASETPENVHRRLSPDCDFLREESRNVPIHTASNLVLYPHREQETPVNTQPRYLAEPSYEADVADDQTVEDAAPGGPAVRGDSGASATVNYGSPGNFFVHDDRTGSRRVMGRDAAARCDQPRMPTDLPPHVRMTQPRFSNMERRLASFQNWPHYMTQTPYELARVGFYFAGYADCVRCFCCGLGLKNWDIDDQPLLEHIRWRSSCPFLNTLVSGQEITNVLAYLGREENAANDTVDSGLESALSSRNQELPPLEGSNVNIRNPVLEAAREAASNMGINNVRIDRELNRLALDGGLDGLTVDGIVSSILDSPDVD